MPVRSFNLKLVVPRGSDDRMLREALWTTHAEVNAATRYYEERLLCLRAMPYEATVDTEVNGRRVVSLGRGGRGCVMHGAGCPTRQPRP